MGRPSKFTEGRKRVILEAIGDGQTYGVAATMAGISAGTLSGWVRDESKGEFVAACKAAEARAESRLVAVMHDHAHSDWRAAKWLLSRRYAHWREVPVQDQAVSDELNRLKVLKAQVELEYARSQLEALRSQEAEDASLLTILNDPMTLEHVEVRDEVGPTDEGSSHRDAEEDRRHPDGQGNGSVTQLGARKTQAS